MALSAGDVFDTSVDTGVFSELTFHYRVNVTGYMGSELSITPGLILEA